MKRKFYALFSILFIFTLVLSACSGSEGSSAALTPTAATPFKSASSTIAEASVVPIQSAYLTFKTSGIVEEILKDESTHVTKGQPIARLQGQEQLQAALTAAKLAVASAQKSLTDLKDNGAVNKTSIELRVANAEKALKDANNDFSNAQYKRGSRDQINEAQARYIVAQDAFKRAESDFNDLASQDDENLDKAYALTVMAQSRRGRDKAKADLDYLLEKPDQYDYAIAQSKVDVAQANLDAAKADLAKLDKDGLNPDDLAVAEASVDNAKAQQAAAQSALDDLTLTAPFDGTIIANNLKVGETASPTSGQTQVVIANSADWQVETTDLTELNINNIKEGDPVTITFDAIPGLELTGKVLRIQSLGTNKQGDITYKVTVKLDKQDARLRWNMTALVTFTNEP